MRASSLGTPAARVRSWAVLSLLLLASACSGDDTTLGSGAAGPGATAASSGAASTGSGGGGGGGVGGAGGAATGPGGQGGGSCRGDQAAWDAIPKTGITCQKNSDCCVVVNECTGEAQVVAAADSAAAAASWPYCFSDCVDCVPAMIDLECKDGECVGYFPAPDPTKPPETGTNHCGQDGVTPPGLTPPKQHFTCSQ